MKSKPAGSTLHSDGLSPASVFTVDTEVVE